MRLLVVMALVAVTGACTPGGTPAASPTAVAPMTVAPASVPSVATPSGSAVATMSPVPTTAQVAPPAATLSGGGISAQPGELGSVTWNGLTSDGPWVVTPNGPAVNAGTALTVAMGDVAPDRWSASWATVSGNQAGQPRDGGTGQGGTPIKVTTPAAAGAWSLRIEAWFGAYNSATWYWRLEVSP